MTAKDLALMIWCLVSSNRATIDDIENLIVEWSNG